MSGPPLRISSGLGRHICGHMSGPKPVPQLPFRRVLLDDSFLQTRALPMPISSGDSGPERSPNGGSSGSGPSSGDNSSGGSSGDGRPTGSGPGGPPIGPEGGFGNGPSGGGPHGEDPSGGNGAGRVPLSEAAKATENVLEGCRRELQLLRRWLRGEDTGPDEGQRGGTGDPSGEEGRLTPSEKALQVAARLEACAGALRNASAPRDR